MGFVRWLWGRARAWAREAWCGRFHFRRHWRVVWVAGGEAALHRRRCGRHWWQSVPGGGA